MTIRMILICLVLGVPPSVGQTQETNKLNLVLTLRTRPGYEAVVGRPIDLVFVLRNQGTTDFAFPIFSCQTVHEATFSVTEPNGTDLTYLGCILVGGPHCFCQLVTNLTVKPQQEIALPTSTTNANEVVVWAPTKTGTHHVLGHYRLPVPASRPVVISSAPISIEVVQQENGKASANKVPEETDRKLADPQH